MRIPEIKERLRELSHLHTIPELDRLADQLDRRQSATRAPAASVRMTPEPATAIRAYAAAHPGISQASIASFFKVNQGRVSEALNGKRT